MLPPPTPMLRFRLLHPLLAVPLLWLNACADDPGATDLARSGATTSAAGAAAHPDVIADEVRQAPGAVAEIGDAAGTTSRSEKGLFTSLDNLWSTAQPLKVCFTNDSTTQEMNSRVESARNLLMNLVDQTWAGYSKLRFNWKTNGAWAVCTSSNHTQFDAVIFMTQDINGGSSNVGKYGGHGITQSWLDHPFATSEFGVSTNMGANYLYIHEMGHFAGLLHEQLRDDTECHPKPDANGNYGGGIPGSMPAGSHKSGDFDGESIMDECSQIIGMLSPGDVATIQQMYGASVTHVRWEVSSWYPTNLYTATNGTAYEYFPNVGNARSGRTGSAALNAGATYAATAWPSDTRVKCHVSQPGAPLVLDHPVHALPRDFEYAPVTVNCVDNAALAMLL